MSPDVAGIAMSGQSCPVSKTTLAIAMGCLLLAGCGTNSEPDPSAPRVSLPAPSAGISRDDAIEAARGAASDMVAEDWQLDGVTQGALGEVMPDREHYDWARVLPGDLRLLRIGFVSGDMGALVVMDPTEGTVYGVVVGIAN